MVLFFFFQAEDGIRDIGVTEFRRVLFRSHTPTYTKKKLSTQMFLLRFFYVFTGIRIPFPNSDLVLVSVHISATCNVRRQRY